MNTLVALVKREILEGKNGFILAPTILAGIAVVLVTLTLMGFGEMQIFDGAAKEGIHNLNDVITKAQEHRPEDWNDGIMVGYWFMTMPVWIALPFVVFFSLLSTLYEERRDRSVLFWKSMPVSDWQEVAVKLAVPVFLVPLIYLAVTIVAQFVIAVLLSFVLLFQGGDIPSIWPLGLMFEVWGSGVAGTFVFGLWMLPIAGWILFVSSFAGRMPFMWAVLPPVLVMVVEGLFNDSHYLAQWIGIHMGGWMDFLESQSNNFDSPRDLLVAISGGPFSDALTTTLTSLNFWTGLLIAGGFVYGAVMMRKKAL